MPFFRHIVVICAICLGVLAACEIAADEIINTRIPEGSPTVAFTADSTFAADAHIAGVDVSGMTLAAAAELVRTELATLERPLTIRAGNAQRILDPVTIDLHVPVDDMLTEATHQAAQSAPVNVPLDVQFDPAQLQAQLLALAEEVYVPSRLDIITFTERLTRSFIVIPGQVLDIDSALQKVTQQLQSSQAARQITLDLVKADTHDVRASFDQIQEQVNAMAEMWSGIVGLYLYDLETGTTVTYNPDTVFSGASIMKVPIMLYAYISLPEFTAEQEQWTHEMIVESNNLSANDLLAATVGSEGTDAALVGVEKMNEWLRDLGLAHTYQNMPYEATDYLIGIRGLTIKHGPAQEGSPPYTLADPMVRTTPAEISRLFLWIEQCRQGAGLLLERFPEALSPQRCQDMLDLLAQTSDTIRMRAGLPTDVRVEHKSGWVEDMHGDVGIVRSPGGDFLLALYLFEEQHNSWFIDVRATPLMAAFAHMVYTAYNPMRVEDGNLERFRAEVLLRPTPTLEPPEEESDAS